MSKRKPPQGWTVKEGFTLIAVWVGPWEFGLWGDTWYGIRKHV